jgi:hypothetical protein
MYADWKSQIAYSSPNWNGFDFTVGVTQAWNATYANQFSADDDIAAANPFNSATSTARGGSSPAFEGKAAYAWTGDVAGKVWASFISQKVRGLSVGGDETANGWDIGSTVNVAGFGLTGYYGQGRGMGTTLQLRDGFDAAGKRRDSRDYYVQATYALPTATKLGLSYGSSRLEGNGAGDTGLGNRDYENRMVTVGAYHPLTKHLNLVAEYSDVETKIASLKGESKTVSLGAILFF